MATPCPTPTHIVHKAKLPLLLCCNWCTAVVTKRAPLMPNGWPSAIAPPRGLTRGSLSARPSSLVHASTWAAKASLNSKISKLLPTNYIRVTIYDTDFRKRRLRGSGLIDSLVCSITVNKSSKIKNIDFIEGKLELKGKYRIVWNGNWKGIKHVC